ncbi:MAG: hypothetical protein U0T73_00070 [Chitinophagales bacterium]
MKNAFSVLALTAILALASCEKDEGKLPNIAFKTGSGYVSANDSVKVDSVFTVGISASKAESADVLKTFNLSRTINGVDSSLVTTSLSGSQGDAFSNDYVLRAAAPAGTKATYTFAVTNRDGLIGKVSLNIVSK